MIDTLTEFIEEDFDYFNQDVEIVFDDDNDEISFYLFSEIDSALEVTFSRTDEMDYMSVDEWRSYFVSHLEYTLTTSSLAYHDYDLFLSRMKFKEDMESFKLRTRKKIQREKVLN